MPSHFELANAIRALSMDAVQKANSGHPGMPMGMADIAEVLWNDFLQHNPTNPTWANRDRFILSNGHGCMLQYALLHLTGYDLSIEDLKQFRQLHSRTPGHPEYKLTPGVETTTGPLGQGFANAVGMALAEAILAKTFNRDRHQIINHFTYCFLGDGCLMEGISHEAGSLAGTLGLGKLIAFWDNNGISIDGKVAGWFLDDTPKRFEAYGWHVIRNVDGHDRNAVKKAIEEAQAHTTQPTLICCKTIIGFGAPNLEGSEKCHGAALGANEVAAAREKLGWKFEPFIIPTDIYKAWDAKEKGQEREQIWQSQFNQYSNDYPELASELMRRLNGDWIDSKEKLREFILAVEHKKENIATRKASQNALDALCALLPEMFGGSADLSESNLTFSKASKAVGPHQFDGNYIYYGVREFGMSAIMNGIALHGGFIPYGGTFLTFLDYARNAVRLSAFMGIQVIFVYTHDSIGLGEDGPTHQPIEHLTILRATPNMSIWRPCDATETAVAWTMALQHKIGPTSLILSRQTLAHQPKTAEQVNNIARGGYVLVDCVGHPIDAIIISTGSEVDLAVKAAKKLSEEDIHVRVVSMPSTDVFLSQDESYKEAVLPKHIKKRIAIEAGATNYWYSWVGFEGGVVGLDRFGESAPCAAVFEAVGITVEAVVAKVKKVLAKKQEFV